MFRKNTTAARAATLLCVLLFLLVLAASAVTTWRATSMFLDGDASTELILSKHLHDEGVLISDTWDYSTEVRVLVTQNLLQIPLFSFIGDWHKIRFISAMLWQVICAAAWGFLARQLGCSLRRFCIGASILLLPFSVAYGRLVLYCIYYCPIIGFCFFMAGLFLWTVRCVQTKTGRGAWIPPAVLAAGSFFSGLHGVRYMMNITAPLIASLVFLLFIRTAERRESLGDLWKQYRSSLIPAAILAVFSAAGMIVYNQVLMVNYHCDHEYVSRALSVMTVNDGWDMVLSWLRDFGYAEGVSLFSREGIAGVMGALCAGASLIAGICWARDREASQAKRFVSLMFLMSLLVVVVYMALVTGEDDFESYGRYFLIAVTFAVPMLLTPASEGGVSRPVTPRGFLSVCCVIAMLFSGTMTLSYFNTLGGNIYMSYDGLTYRDQLTVWKLTGTVDFLQKEGYTTGLALGASGYWYSPVITEMTDGAVSLGYLGNEGTIRMNDRSFLTDPSQLTEGRFFLIVENDKESVRFYEGGWADGGTVVYQDSYFTVVEYDDPVAKVGYLCVPRK